MEKVGSTWLKISPGKFGVVRGRQNKKQWMMDLVMDYLLVVSRQMLVMVLRTRPSDWTE
jgi:hypothetical protein